MVVIPSTCRAACGPGLLEAASRKWPFPGARWSVPFSAMAHSRLGSPTTAPARTLSMLRRTAASGVPDPQLRVAARIGFDGGLYPACQARERGGEPEPDRIAWMSRARSAAHPCFVASPNTLPRQRREGGRRASTRSQDWESSSSIASTQASARIDLVGLERTDQMEAGHRAPRDGPPSRAHPNSPAQQGRGSPASASAVAVARTPRQS